MYTCIDCHLRITISCRHKKRILIPELTAETTGEADFDLFSAGGGDDVDGKTGLACLANFRSAAAKLAWPPDMDVSVDEGWGSFLCSTGCNPGDADFL